MNDTEELCLFPFDFMKAKKERKKISRICDYVHEIKLSKLCS